jgi:hypothetical protein
MTSIKKLWLARFALPVLCFILALICGKDAVSSAKIVGMSFFICFVIGISPLGMISLFFLPVLCIYGRSNDPDIEGSAEPEVYREPAEEVFFLLCGLVGLFGTVAALCVFSDL